MRRLYFLTLCILSFSGMTAQEELSKEEKQRRQNNIDAANPFKQFGYNAKVATLSKGKYLEVHDLDSIVTIGSVRFHVEKMKIVGVVVPDSTDREFARPIGDIASRWLSPDPLAEEYPDWTPYRYGFNNPIRYNDPTGLLETDFGVNDKGEVKQIGPTDNKPDRLFKLNNDGSVNKDVAAITVNDKELLPQLTEKNPDLEQKHHADKKEVLKGSSATTKSTKESLNVFKFMAENTKVEWALQGNNSKSGLNWMLGTVHSNDQAPTFYHIKGFERNSLAFHYHAHTDMSWNDFKPSANDINSYRRTLEVSPNAQFYIYMPKLTKGNYNKVKPSHYPSINYEPSKMYPVNKSNINQF